MRRQAAAVLTNTPEDSLHWKLTGRQMPPAAPPGTRTRRVSVAPRLIRRTLSQLNHPREPRQLELCSTNSNYALRTQTMPSELELYPPNSNYALRTRTMPSELKLCPPNSNRTQTMPSELKLCPPNSNYAPRTQTMPSELELCPANSRPSDSVSLRNVAETKLYVTRVWRSLTLKPVFNWANVCSRT